MLTNTFTESGSNDEYKILFETEDHKYFVSKNGGDLIERPSATGIINTIPFWSIPYGAKHAAEAAAKHVHTLYGDEIDKTLLNYWKKAPDRHRDAAGDIGTAFHTCAHHFRTGDMDGVATFAENTPVTKRMTHFIPWWIDLLKQGYADIASEIILYHPELEYAGTCDAILKTPDGKFLVADWKTGSIKDDGWLQVMAYQEAYSAMYDIDPENWAPPWQINVMLTKTVVHETTPHKLGVFWRRFLRRVEDHYDV